MRDDGVHWRDPSSPWSRRLRKQCRWHAINAGWTAVVAACAWWALLAWREELRLGPIWLVCLLAILFAPTLVFARWLARDRRVHRLVPTLEGFLCPLCRRTLERLGDDGRCGPCGVTFAASQLHDYWAHAVLEPRSTHLASLCREFRRGRRDHGLFTTYRLWSQESPVRSVGVTVALITLCLFALALATSQGPLAVVLDAGWIALLTIGIQIMGLAWWRRGSSRHCTRCGFQKPPDHAEPQRCPECGARWRHPGGTLRGRMSWSSRPFWIGASVVAIGLYLAAGQFGMMSAYPTSLLIWGVTAKRGSVIHEWRALFRRDLSDAQEASLARRLLDKRRRDDQLSPDGDAWLLGRIAKGTLPADVIERYYREMAEPWIVAPDRARVGETVTIGLGLVERGPPPVINGVSYFVGGYSVGDSTRIVGRFEKPALGVHAAVQHRRGRSGVVAANGPTVEVIPERPGAVQVRLELWMVYGPMSIADQPIVWQSDETPLVPENAIWSGRIFLEKVITVGEADPPGEARYARPGP